MKKIALAAFPSALFLVGLALLGSGLLTPDSAATLAMRTAPILLFVVAMTVVTELANSAGLFGSVTARLARWGARAGTGEQGRGRIIVLWLIVIAVATLSTAFLSLDTTAVLVTPVVVFLARHARIHPLPFALTTVWLANTASLFLPVSNLTNLLAQHRLGLSPLGFTELLWAPALLGVAVPTAALWLLFRKDLHGRFTAPEIPQAADKRLLAFSGVTVAVLLPALVSGIAVWIPAAIAAAFLLVVFSIRKPGALRWTMLPLQPLLLAMGLFLVVATLHDHGLATVLAGAAGSGNGFVDLLQMAGVGALGANAANNLPAYLALEPLADSPMRLAALLIGVNLGPLVSPWASLATLLWHSRLKAMGVEISWRAYALAGVGLSLVLVPTAVLGLWLSAGAPG